MVWYKEFFGLCWNFENNCEGFVDLLIDLELVGILNCVIWWVLLECSSFNVLLFLFEFLYNSIILVYDCLFFFCICEGVSGGLNSSVEVLEEYLECYFF